MTLGGRRGRVGVEEGQAASEQQSEYPQIPWITSQSIENRQNFPLEELIPYEGKYVAWDWERTAVLACDDDWGGVWDKVKAMGHDPQFCPANTSGSDLGFANSSGRRSERLTTRTVSTWGRACLRSAAAKPLLLDDGGPISR